MTTADARSLPPTATSGSTVTPTISAGAAADQSGSPTSRSDGALGRVIAYATSEIMAERGWRYLATIRQDGVVLRSIPFSDVTAVQEVLRDEWRKLPFGDYLLTIGSARAPEYYAVRLRPDGMDVMLMEAP